MCEYDEMQYLLMMMMVMFTLFIDFIYFTPLHENHLYYVHFMILLLLSSSLLCSYRKGKDVSTVAAQVEAHAFFMIHHMYARRKDKIISSLEKQ